MTNDIKNILKKLKLDDTGTYKNHYYIIKLSDSDEYAKMYSQLSELAVNTEYPDFGTNTAKNVVRVTNYFELDDNNITYNIFLIANFDTNEYYIKIGEKPEPGKVDENDIQL